MHRSVLSPLSSTCSALLCDDGGLFGWRTRHERVDVYVCIAYSSLGMETVDVRYSPVCIWPMVYTCTRTRTTQPCMRVIDELFVAAQPAVH
jgi:hypothetical protein